MIACLRLFSALCLAALLAACASSPSSSLGELPRTPDASIEQLLEQAATAKTPEKAALLRLSAADMAYARTTRPLVANSCAGARWTPSSPAHKCLPAPWPPNWPWPATSPRPR